MYKLIEPYDKLRIGIDIDGVLADFNTPYLEKLVSLNWGRVPPRVQTWDEKVDPDCFHWEESYGFKPETREFFWEMMNQDSHTAYLFWNSLERQITAEQRDELLKNYIWPHHVYFITNRRVPLARVTEKWLANTFNDDPNYTLLHTQHKGHIAKGLALHGHIDDKPKNLEEILSQCGTSCVPILLNRPWNLSYQNPNVKKVNSLIEGLDLIKAEVASVQNNKTIGGLS